MRSTRMFGALIPGTVYHSRDEVQRIQDAVARKSVLIDNSATSCAALDQATLTGWRLNGYIPAQQYAQEDVPSSVNFIGLNSMWESGIALQQQLDTWAAQLRGDGCNVPIVLPPKPYEDIISAAKWIGGTLVVLAGVVAVVKIAEVIDDAERMI